MRSLPVAILASAIVVTSISAQVPQYPDPPVQVRPLAECPASDLSGHARIMVYDPSVTIWPTSALPADAHAGPEGHLSNHLAAMASGDYPAFLAGWTPSDRIAIEARNDDRGRGLEEWETGWIRLFGAYDEVRLVGRADYSGFVILAYRMTPKAGSGQRVLTRPMVYRWAGEEWLLTNEFSSTKSLFSWLQCVE